MSTVVTALFRWPLGDDAALIPRSPAIAEAYQELFEANFERLARWFPFDRPPTLDETRAGLARRGEAWLDGTQLPLAIVVKAENRWRLVGQVDLLIDGAERKGDVGYWLDAGFEGRGLMTRAITTVLNHAFGQLGLRRVELRAITTNERSRNVAQRLGFTQEGVMREAALFPDGPRDEVVYGLLAHEWRTAAK